jgi:predicted  nucleic acid-binding Zn-ribbon protein
MDQSANIRTFDALKEFRRALQKYEEETRAALASAKSNMQRAVTRLQSDRLAHWKREQQKWTRKLAEAKVDLNRVQMEKGDIQASAVIERKRVAQAKQNLEEAERRIQRIRYWATVLDRERLTAQGQCQQLERTLEHEIPRLKARIERMLDELEQYVKLAAPARSPDSADAASDSQSMAQRGETRPENETTQDGGKPSDPPNNRQN